MCCGRRSAATTSAASPTPWPPADVLDLPPGSVEFQMLYGMAEPIKDALVDLGQRVRIYTPYGQLLPGMAYLVRRLLENTANESFLRASFTEHVSEEKLLMKPANHPAPDAVLRTCGRHRPAGRSPHASAFRQRAARRLQPRSQPPGDARRPSPRCAKQLGRHLSARHRRQATSTTERLRSTRSIRRTSARSSAAAAGRRQSTPSRPSPRPRTAFPAWRDTDPAEACRAISSRRRRGHAAAALRAGRLAGLRVRQELARGRRRRGRGHRLLRVLRPRNAAPGRAAPRRRARRGQRLLLRAARRRRRHRPVELPAGDPVRHDRGRPGHRQHGHHEAGGAIVRHRRQAHGGLPGGRPAAPASSTICPASARRSARRWSSIPTSP